MRAKMVMLLSLLVVLPCHEGAGAETAPPDFSTGFAKLVELGMPDLDATAVWVASRQVEVPYALRQRVKQFKGAGWLIGTGKEARILPLGGLEAAETKPLPAKPDLDKDLEALLAAMAKDAQKDEDERGLFEYYGDGEELVASLMLFAAQLHQTGRAEQANRLAAALFAVFPERETVIDCAVNSIAGFQYGKLTDEFFQRHDWTAYHAGLVALTERFPRGWLTLEAVGVFLPQLAKQAQGLRPEPPALPGIEIDPRALAAVAALTEPPPAQTGENGMGSYPTMPRGMSRWEMEAMMGMGGGGHGGGWLLAEPADPDKATEATARLRALGMAAVPALAALLGDPFLTPRPNSGSGQSSVWDDEDGLARIYGRMSRPAARGEIARQLLLGALPDPDRELGRVDDGELRELALEFWRAHRAASREELALVFLREGGEPQAAEAVAILAKAADPRFHEAVEEYFLAQDPAHGAYDLVRAYLQIRKQAAKPFFEKYAGLVRRQAPEINDEDISYGSADYRLRQMGGVDKLLKSLAALVNDREPRAVAVEIAKGKPEDAEAAIRELRQTMAGISPLKQLHALLEGANAAKDPAVRGHFLMTSLSIRWPEDDEDAEDDESPADQRQPRRKVSAAEERVWRKLMGDKRETKAFPLARSYGRELPFETIGDMARAAFENSVVPEGIWRLVRAAEFMDLTALELLRATVAARLDGKPVPVLPDSEKVTPERLEAIVAEAGKLQPAAISPYIKTLSPDERAAWAGWLEDPDEGPEKPPSVEALKWFVQARKTENFSLPPPAREVTTFDPGFLLDADWLLARCRIMAGKPGEFSPYCMLLDDGASGLEVVELLLKPAPAAPDAAKPPAEGDGADTGDEADGGEATREDEDAEGEAREVWQLVFGVLHEALGSHPGALAAVSLRGNVQDEDGVMVLVTKEGTLALPKGEGAQKTGDVGAALRTFLSEREPGSLVLCALARTDIPMIFGDGDGADESTNDAPAVQDSGKADGPPPAYTEPIPE